MNFKVTDGPKVFELIAKDAKGNITSVQDPLWSVADMGLASLTSEGQRVTVEAIGPIGANALRFTGDADLGEGVKPVVAELEMNFTAGDAVEFEIKEIVQE